MFYAQTARKNEPHNLGKMYLDDLLMYLDIKKYETPVVTLYTVLHQKGVTKEININPIDNTHKSLSKDNGVQSGGKRDFRTIPKGSHETLSRL